MISKQEMIDFLNLYLNSKYHFVKPNNPQKHKFLMCDICYSGKFLRLFFSLQDSSYAQATYKICNNDEIFKKLRFIEYYQYLMNIKI